MCTYLPRGTLIASSDHREGKSLDWYEVLIAPRRLWLTLGESVGDEALPGRLLNIRSSLPPGTVRVLRPRVVRQVITAEQRSDYCWDLLMHCDTAADGCVAGSYTKFFSAVHQDSPGCTGPLYIVRN